MKVPPADDLRDLERASLLDFVGGQARYFGAGAAVLDYGCGREPYRGIVVRAGGEYVGYDRPSFPANVGTSVRGPEEPLEVGQTWDVILCTQVLQYVRDPQALLVSFNQALRPDGALILTGPTNWPEVEPEDLWRFTVAGARRMLEQAGFDIRELRSRGSVRYGAEEFSVGWGAVAHSS